MTGTRRILRVAWVAGLLLLGTVAPFQQAHAAEKATAFPIPKSGLDKAWENFPWANLLARNTNASAAPITPGDKTGGAGAADAGLPLTLEAARQRYLEDARTNKITLTVPLYTNAPWSEVRLRAAALAGDGLAASLCHGSNDVERAFWSRLAATNGWVPAQIQIAKELEEVAATVAELRITNLGLLRAKQAAVSGVTDGGLMQLEFSGELTEPQIQQSLAKTVPGVEFVRWVGHAPGVFSANVAIAKAWREKASASLPKLQSAATTNGARTMLALGKLHLSGDLVASNSVLAVRFLRSAVASGLAAAQYELGSYYEWRETNAVEAANWHYLAATQGLLRAQSALTSLHAEPWEWRFDPRFHRQARERARWEFEAGSQPVACQASYGSCWSLGGLYQAGQGVESNAVEAVKWYRRAADMGVVSNGGFAEYELALCCFSGDGVPQSDEEGLRWVQKAIANGHEDDRDNEGFSARIALADKDYAKALKYWRKLAAQGDVEGELGLAGLYSDLNQNDEAAKWFRKAAQRGDPRAQYGLACRYRDGLGVWADVSEEIRLFTAAADQDHIPAQFELSRLYGQGTRVPRDFTRAAQWLRRAAELGVADAQNNLGVAYAKGEGVPRDYVEAYKWYNLAAASGDSKVANENLDGITRFMTPAQIAEAQRRSSEFVPRKRARSKALPDSPDAANLTAPPQATGTGFFITDDGYLITNQHVAANGSSLKVRTATGDLPAKLIRTDAANDLALLKVEGRFTALPVKASRGVRLGETVATVGFPNPGLQGFSPKLTKGEISSLAGLQDDPRHFQISLPVQPGNSGGALVDAQGNVVGVVVAKLSQRAALATTGTLAENVNYAVKSSFLLSFLESVPGLSGQLPESRTTPRPFEEVVTTAEQATVLVLVY